MITTNQFFQDVVRRLIATLILKLEAPTSTRPRSSGMLFQPAKQRIFLEEQLSELRLTWWWPFNNKFETKTSSI